MRWPPRGTPVSAPPLLGGHLVDAERHLPLDRAGVEVVGRDLRPAAFHDVREAEAVAGVVARLSARRRRPGTARRPDGSRARPDSPDRPAHRRSRPRTSGVGRRSRRAWTRSPGRRRPSAAAAVRAERRAPSAVVGDEARACAPHRRRRSVDGNAGMWPRPTSTDLAEVVVPHARAEAEQRRRRRRSGTVCDREHAWHVCV